ERYRDQVFRYCWSRTGAKHEAEDLVADVFIRAMEALDRYEDRGLPFVAFLFRIARNAAIDRSRKTRPDMSIDELVNHPESDQNVEADAVRSIERDTLFKAMSKLKPDYREVLLLRFVEGYGAADVGRMTGRSEGAARTPTTRCTARGSRSRIRSSRSSRTLSTTLASCTPSAWRKPPGSNRPATRWPRRAHGARRPRHCAS